MTSVVHNGAVYRLASGPTADDLVASLKATLVSQVPGLESKTIYVKHAPLRGSGDDQVYVAFFDVPAGSGDLAQLNAKKSFKIFIGPAAAGTWAHQQPSPDKLSIQKITSYGVPVRKVTGSLEQITAALIKLLKIALSA